MKKLSLVLAAIMLCMLISMPAHASTVSSYEYQSNLNEIAAKYGYTIKSTQIAQSVLPRTEVEKQLVLFEQKLANGKAALIENNRKAEEEWQKVLLSGRIDYTQHSKSILFANPTPIPTTYTAGHYIGYAFPSATLIRSELEVYRVFNDAYQRYEFGSLIDMSSDVFSFSTFLRDAEWEETDTRATRLDLGRTYFAEYWGDLEEEWYDGWGNEFEATSVGWRLYFYAYVT